MKFKKLNEKAVAPFKAHPTDAGYDLTAVSRVYDKDGNVVYGTGIAVEIPDGFAGLVFPRSSICKKDLALTNSVGVIDSGYRGEVMVKFKPTLTPFAPKIYEVGERIAQLIVVPYLEEEFIESDELTESGRGTGGFGSSGR